MRKVLVLLVVVAAAAVAAGLAIPADAVRVAGGSLTSGTLSDELQAIGASPAYQCYLEAREFSQSGATTVGVTGATSSTWSTTAAGAWANLRATQLAVEGFVAAREPAAFRRPALARARYELAISIEEAIASAVQQANSAGGGYSCAAVEQSGGAGQQVRLLPGAKVLAATPSWFQRAQVRAEAAFLGLIGLLQAAVPEAGHGLAAWYAAHAQEFDTTCVSVIVVSSDAQAKTLRTRILGGLAFATAARRYSLDPSKSRGGSLGCIKPTNEQTYTEVQHLVQSVTTGGIAVVPLSATSYLLITPTRRLRNAFHSIERAVRDEAHSLNVQGAQQLATVIQTQAGVTVGAALGSWVPTQLGGQLVDPSSPPAATVTNTAANSPT